jgi:hypothetical protein
VPAPDLDPAAPAGGAGGLVTGATRRAVLAASASLAGLAVAGCGQARPPEAGARTGRSAKDGDEAVLGSVRTELAAAVDVVAATRRAHPRLRRPLAPLEAAHRDQLAVLDPDGGTTPGPGAGVPAGADAALSRLREAEERLVRRLLTWAVAVDSGPLARVLVATAAGTAQHLAALSPPPAPTQDAAVVKPPGGEGVGPPGATPEALQQVLATEHAAVWSFGSLGAATSMSTTPVLFEQVGTGWSTHRGLRDVLQARVLAAGEAPVGSRAAYDVPQALDRPEDVAIEAARVERACADAWTFLVASSTGSTRRWAGGVAVALATSAVRFGAAPESLPGAADVLG